jgi:hypothetical protein
MHATNLSFVLRLYLLAQVTANVTLTAKHVVNNTPLNIAFQDLYGPQKFLLDSTTK